MRKSILSIIILVFALFPLSALADTEVQYEQYILQLMNDSRREMGLAPYTLSTDWSMVARSHSEDLAERTGGNIASPTTRKMSHNSSDGSTSEDRIEASGYPWQSFGENIGWGGAIGTDITLYEMISNIHSEMMAEPADDSTNHRGHIMSETYDTVGIGVAILETQDSFEIYYTVDFIQTPVNIEPVPIEEEEPDIEPVVEEPKFDTSIPDSEVIGSKQEVDITYLERLFVNLINEEREKRGLTALVWDTRLSQSAEDWTKYMIQNGAVTHDRRDGSTPHQWIEKYNLPFLDDYEDNYFTENIFRGAFGCLEECIYTPEAEIRNRFKDFMSEESTNGSHFRSIVHPDFTHIGIYVDLKTKNEFYGTIHYGRIESQTRTFPDIDENHPSRDAIEYLFAQDIIGGYPDGLFRPGKVVTRAEILKFIFNGLKISIDDSAVVNFPDVPKNTWYYPYVATAVSKGIIKGYEDGSYRPNNTISRVEALKMILNAKNVFLPKVESNIFSDVHPDDWFAPYVKYAVYNKLLDHPGKRFGVSDGMNREDISTMIYRMITGKL